MRTWIDSGLTCPARTLSSGSDMAPGRVSPENPAKSMVTFCASKARSMWGLLREVLDSVTGR
jgi:hypothetical protein